MTAEKKILVTGGTGLVGSHLLYELVQQGFYPKVLYRKEKGKESILRTFSFYHQNPQALFNQLEFIEGDVLDIYSIVDALKDVNQVYHCAAIVSFAPKDADEMTKINVDGTANVVNACLESGVEKLCHVSSVAALGKAAFDEEVNEKTFWKSSPENSTYSISKYSSEREVWRGVQEGLNTIVVNPTVILGPGDWTKGSSNLFRSAKKGMKFYTQGATGFVDVRDVAACMVKLMLSTIVNERFLLNAENYSYRKFFDIANRCFGNPAPSIKASVQLSELVWRLEKLRGFITQSTPLITKETTRSAHQVNRFSNKKITAAIAHSFIPIEQSIRDTAALFNR